MRQLLNSDLWKICSQGKRRRWLSLTEILPPHPPEVTPPTGTCAKREQNPGPGSRTRGARTTSAPGASAAVPAAGGGAGRAGCTPNRHKKALGKQTRPSRAPLQGGERRAQEGKDKGRASSHRSTVHGGALRAHPGPPAGPGRRYLRSAPVRLSQRCGYDRARGLLWGRAPAAAAPPVGPARPLLPVAGRGRAGPRSGRSALTRGSPTGPGTAVRP